MTNCVKCGAELIGSRKFCAACGAPTDPSSLKRADAPGASGPASSPVPAPAPQINVPSTAYGPPIVPGSPPVNPFAATASPASRAMGTPPYGPPPATTSSPPSGPNAPGAPGPLDGTAPAPPVSPLAVSNALSQRGAFQNAAGDRIPPSAPGAPGSAPRAGTGTSPPPPLAGASPPPGKKPPGTQLMPSIPNPSSAPPGSSAPAASQVKPPPQRTQVMDAASFARLNPANAKSSAPNQPVAAPVPSPAQPIPTPASVHQPQPPSVAYHQAPSAQPGQWSAGGWGAPANAPHGGYGGFGYAPGARVNVTWSNGQRYPAQVSQVSGTQVLVVFPDGQQHWVEMQYLSPG